MLNDTFDNYRLFLARDLDLTGFRLGPVMGFAFGDFHCLILSEERFPKWRRATGRTAEESGFSSWQGQEVFLVSTAFGPAVEPTQSSIE